MIFYIKQISLILLFLIISFVSISAQVEGKEIINRDIEWADFIGDIDKSSKFYAVTNWAITYNFSRPTFEGNKARVKVSTYLFLLSNSWVKPNKQTPRLLNHERGHFKIGKICAGEIEKTINSKFFDRNNYAEEIAAVYWEIIKKYQEFEKQYDEETDHFNNQEQQLLWDKKLNNLLNEFEQNNLN